MRASAVPAWRSVAPHESSASISILDGSGHYLPCVSSQMQALAASLARVAATDAPVLICGETGTGKTTLARQVHEDSPRRNEPLIILQGAGATADLLDRLASSAPATVLIEEVGELIPSLQDGLVRVLSLQTSQPGRLRFLTTTSRNLNELARRRGLRADLVYRLDVVRLEIPPLRQRPEDILFLAEHFLLLAAQSFRKDVRGLSADAYDRLLQHRWPGNVRELGNCVVESVLYSSNTQLRAADLRIRTAVESSDPECELSNALTRLHAAQPAEFYRRTQELLLRWALKACSGNRLRAAALLGIGRGALRAKLRRYGLEAAVRGSRRAPT